MEVRAKARDARGRFVRTGVPGTMRAFARDRVEENWPDITNKFVEEAKKGSCSHASFLVKVAGIDREPLQPEPPGEERTLAEMLLGDQAED